MEGEQSGPGMDFGAAVLRKPTPSRPQPQVSSFSNKRSHADSFSLMSGFAAAVGRSDQEADPSFSLMPSVSMSSAPGDDGRDEGLSQGGPRALGGSGSFADRLKARGVANKETEPGGMLGPSGLSANLPGKMLPPSRITTPPASYQLTIPPGLSPTQLLESPVFIPNPQQAEPSPTTGTFALPPYQGERSSDKINDQGSTPGFFFQPFPNYRATPVQASSSMNLAVPSNVAIPLSMPLVPANNQRPQPERIRSPSPEQEAPVSAAPFIERPSEDGYNWRKYGQKQVKGSEYPRSYYKCTNPKCLMKKKVERSLDGQVTEIVYKGEHNHPKPVPTRRVPAAHLIPDDVEDRIEYQRNGGDAYHDDPSSSARKNSLSLTLGATEPSSPSTSDDDSKSVNEDADDDDPEAKRRRKENKAAGVSSLPPAHRTIKEPRVVVQTQSDVDILDDGYRWRKYGQKVVKGNPHPRSYYKCTHMSCPVRKHVERASNDPKAVITTYEGKHNHDVPVARNSGHDNAGLGVSGVAAPPQPGGGASSIAPAGINSAYPQTERYSSSVFGRLLNDGSKGEGGASEADLGMEVGLGGGVGQTMRIMDGSNTHNHNQLPQHLNHHHLTDGQNTNMSMNMSGPPLGARPLDPYGNFSGMHDPSGLRPKQEQDDSHIHNNSVLQSNVYHPQRLVLGP